jgi:hypothetical protein
MIFKDQMPQPTEGLKMAMHLRYEDEMPRIASGTLTIEMKDARTGEVLHYSEHHNKITYDASILVAILTKDPASRAHGIFMLAVGTGATGALLAPNAPDARQRKLNAEIARKAFSSTTFRDALGNAVAIPTNIVDFTASFGEAEAVGPLTEMGLISPISSNPLVVNPNPNAFPVRDVTIDVSTLDLLINYLTFPCIFKPSTAIMTLTWRLTY